MKTCTQCGRADLGFYRHRRHKDGLDTFCKKCRGKANARNYQNAKSDRAKYQAEYRIQHLDHIKKQKRVARTRAPEIPMWRSARLRAQKRGVPFSITPEDVRQVWPKDGLCPVLGAPLRVANRRFDSFSPTIDAFQPELGYVPGNIHVVSFLANTIKRDVTDPTILEKVASWMRKQKIR